MTDTDPNLQEAIEYIERALDHACGQPPKEARRIYDDAVMHVLHHTYYVSAAPGTGYDDIDHAIAAAPRLPYYSEETRMEIRRRYAGHRLLGPIIQAIASGMRWDTVSECYVRPERYDKFVPDLLDSFNDPERKHTRGVGGNYDKGLSAVEAANTEAWKAEASPTRYKRRASPKADGLIDLASKLPRKPELLAKSAPQWLDNALAALTPNERTVYEGRHMTQPPRTYGELAEEMGLSRPRIVQLEAAGRKRMLKLLKA